MATLEEIIPGVRATGILPTEPVAILSVQWHGQEVLEVAYRSESGTTGSTVLYRDNEPTLKVIGDQKRFALDASGEAFKLAAEALRLRLATLFDPLLAVHTSLVEPLPHQLLAVYESMLPRQPLRFLLADDPGAGKTVMAGLLIKELMARGDLERCLIVSPGSLVEQWQDELWQKFQVEFEIVTNDQLEAAASGNWFKEHPLCIARLDKLSRDEDLHHKLAEIPWDLIVVDEAHKMSASWFGGEAKYTKRYQLGKRLSEITRHFLLMSATPHNGKDEDFRLFLSLLDGDRFEGKPRESETLDVSDLMRRMTKEQLRRFDGTPLFPERRAYTVAYELSPEEAKLYEAVSEYVRTEFNRADAVGEGARRTVGFALTILQRRLASSPEAIYQSLRRRRERLTGLLMEAKSAARAKVSACPDLVPDLDEDDLPAGEQETLEEEVMDAASAAQTVTELQAEIQTLESLEQQAMAVKRSGADRKWRELSQILQGELTVDSRGNPRKMILFTEHKDTLDYLRDRISTLLGRPEAIRMIRGNMGRDERRAAADAFLNDPEVRILLATDAAGEGLNLQRANLLVNYDLPWNPNRLEQRFGRIHRIGQTEVCHCWNLVAHETREGMVYKQLLDKIAAEREALGSDKVFDVLGQLFEGTSLRELLLEAIRYGEQPEVREQLRQKVDTTLTTQHVQQLLDRHALAQQTMDTRKISAIREDMERADARRLQPHFVEAFFREAFERLGGRMSAREKKRHEIARVPGSVRQRGNLLGRRSGVLDRYERVAFDKEYLTLDGQPQAAFLCPGHPLMEAVVDLTLEQGRAMLKQGTILLDPRDAGTTPRMLLGLEHAIQETDERGAQRKSSQRMLFVEVPQGGEPRPAGAAPYLDYQPVPDAQRIQLASVLASPFVVSDHAQAAISFAMRQLVPQHVQEIKNARLLHLDKAAEAVKKRLTAEIAHWDHRASELRLREAAGQPHHRMNADNASKRAEELAARLQRRMDALARARHLLPAPPVVFAGALVVPQGLLDQLEGKAPATPDLFARETERVELAAMGAAMEAERRLGFTPRDVSAEKCGYDIESAVGDGRLRQVEVKGRVKGATTFTITRNEILTACNRGESFILALVEVDGDKTRVCHVAAPFNQPTRAGAVSENLDWGEFWGRGRVQG